jgi:hypothetical protein
LRLRAYATPGYAAASIDGRQLLEQTLADANPTLASDLGIRLELADYQVWSSAGSDDDLSKLLHSIGREDPATDVDWVVVLASPRHMVAMSPDQIGLATMLHRYFALRAMSDADEFDAIEQSFTELSEEEKRKLYAARKRHKTAVVLLHELGHTLGVPHELDEQSLMSARYDRHASGFSSYAARIARHALTLRSTTPGTELYRSTAQAALNALRAAPEHTFEAVTAQESERLLESQATVRPAPASLRAAMPATPLPAPVPAAQQAESHLKPADRALFARARALLDAGNLDEARSTAAPLFGAYPDDYAVQELRCQLALKSKLSIEREQQECAALRSLSGPAF